MLEALESWLTVQLDSGTLFVYPGLLLVGVAASFTPCTYPVLPLTVGYLGSAAGGDRRKAFLYSLALVFGLALVYAAVGTVFAALGMPLGVLSGNGWVLTAISLFFILMSLFLLDVFTFPTLGGAARLQGRVRQMGGLLGAFLTGAVSGLIVGPCTGPILFAVMGYVVVGLEAASTPGEFVMQAFSGGLKLFVFGLGQGAIIVLCGLFTGFLGRLPRSGRWLGRVKKAFALLLLGGAVLLLLHTGATTGFDPLGRLLEAAETEETLPDPAPPDGRQEPFGGDEFLDAL